MFKKIFIVSIIAIFSTVTKSAEPVKKKEKSSKENNFTINIEIPNTSIKNQNRTGTCWSFSTISFIESELLRTQKKEYNLSEMFVVHNTYGKKAEKYVRMHGATNFAAGGEPNDVMDIVKNYGIIPEEIYSGLKVDSSLHIHYEMDRVLKEYVDAVIKNPNKKLTNVWHEGFMSIIDSYLGEVPEEFTYEDKTYTPKSFGDSLGINPDDYVTLTSFTHHPFYSKFILEIPDNWSWGSAYNLPLNEFMQVVEQALGNGYSMAWAADVSEQGFMFSDGLAVAPKVLYQPNSEEELKKVTKLSHEKRNALFCDMDKPIEELVVTQLNRQQAFDDFSTTDDHGMHLLGKATDKNGKEYYYIKNSWGTDNAQNGYMFISEEYFKYKTISVMLHKDAIPQVIKDKLNI